jgi:hypothetical protein
VKEFGQSALPVRRLFLQLRFDYLAFLPLQGCQERIRVQRDNTQGSRCSGRKWRRFECDDRRRRAMYGRRKNMAVF